MSEVFLGNPGTSRKVIFGEPTGFCGGVMSADTLTRQVAEAAAPMGIPVNGYHAIVHNQNVVDEHKARGVRFIDDYADTEPLSAAIVSAHGASPEVFAGLDAKGCEVFDATCPLVGRTHKGIQEARDKNQKVLYICKGKPGEVETLHDEVIGAVGHMDFYRDDKGALIHAPVERAFVELGDEMDEAWLSEGGAYHIVCQTTLNADHVIEKMAQIKASIETAQEDATVDYAKTTDVCLAVSGRQNAVRNLLSDAPDRVVIVTDPTSKNGRGYVTLAEQEVAAAEGTTEVIEVRDREEAKSKLTDIEGTTVIIGSASTPNRDMADVARLIDPEITFASNDRPFNIRDGKPQTIETKLASLAARRALVGL